MTFRTIARALEDAAQSTRNGFRFLDEATTAEPFFSFGGVERATALFGGGLQAFGLKKGDRVALILPDNQDFVFAFLGAIRAGLVPVPIYPPAGLRKLGGYLESTLHIVLRSGAKVLVTDSEIKPLLGTVQARARELRAIVSVEALRRSQEPLREVAVDLEDTAFLQFTSGSTSAPKGVVVSHANVAHNVHAFMKLGIRIEDGVDSGVSWLPLYHDMGLIGFVLGPLYHRNTVTFLPPFAFLKRPVRWLEAISRHRATISFGPNFAYALCCKRIKDAELAGLDLSSWRVAGCGAEPIRAGNLEDFSARFAQAGFDRRAFMPSYGMAEATLAIAFGEVGQGFRVDTIDAERLESDGVAEPAREGLDAWRRRAIVSCGSAFPDHEVAVFPPDDESSATPLPERRVGELRVRGPSVTSGYHDEPGLNAATFAGGWLKTGDLGYLAGGEVYICGRSKELIIVNGRNYYPQDLEWEASGVEGVRKGNVIAFGTRKPLNDRERVVVVFETPLGEGPSRDALKAEVQKAVRQGTGLSIDDVVGVELGVLPKTSSGKLKRAETRELYERGQLFIRSSARQGGSVDTVTEMARSQLGYLRDAIRGDRPKE
ncbi:MAG: fatty acyl-AMP ligase [Deltaproteobacteria bacterium]|nr:fatty acyl-AMP ligase [Deltaproteobacteria bacterium]